MTAEASEVGLEDHRRVPRAALDHCLLLPCPCCLCSAEVEEAEAVQHHSPCDLHCHTTQTDTYVNVNINFHTKQYLYNGLLSGTTRLSQYQKCKTNPDFTEARDSEWQCHQLSPLSFRTGWMPFVPPNQ